MEKRKPPLEELTYFNAICCLLVVLIHVLSNAVSSLRTDSWQYALVLFPWRMAAFVVPAFLFSGAVKMARTFSAPLDTSGYLRYLGRRIRKVYLPYLVWNLVYYLCFLRIGYVRGTLSDFLHYVLTGTLSAPFYYVLITMQFYILLPLWRWMVEKLCWPFALCLSFPVTFLSINLNSLLHPLGLELPYLDRIFPSYLCFWVMGLYAGAHYGEFTGQLSMKAREWWLGLSVIFLGAFALWLQKSRQLYFIDLNVWKFFTDTISILLLLGLCRHLCQASKNVKKHLLSSATPLFSSICPTACF